MGNIRAFRVDFTPPSNPGTLLLSTTFKYTISLFSSGDDKMGTITISLSDELEKTMKEFKLDWSEVAARAISDKAEKLRRLKVISSKIKISDKSAKEFTDRISESVAKRFREEK